MSKAEQECKNLIAKYLNTQTGHFQIKNKDEMDFLVKAMGGFENQNITCSAFKDFRRHMLPFVFWFNKSSKLIKNYSRAIGVKSSQLNFIDCIDLKQETSPYKDFESNFELLMAIHTQLQTDMFKFFGSTEEGKFIEQILEKTNAVKDQFYELKQQKREPDFDLAKYFKMLDQVQNSGLPVEAAIVEEARIELKREKWIKKFNDL